MGPLILGNPKPCCIYPYIVPIYPYLGVSEWDANFGNNPLLHCLARTLEAAFVPLMQSVKGLGFWASGFGKKYMCIALYRDYLGIHRVV